ncbi:MAG: hypothetical protein RI922_1442 [Bacteroidota bacterium]|jgi:glycerophosphoryl diester phosphodiesterase
MRFNCLFLIVLLSACTKTKSFEGIEVLGHAATGLENINSPYHDNTKEAVEYALSMEGCDGIEIDVQLSLDGELWLFHNPKLDEETNATGCIPNLIYNDLKNTHYTTIGKEKLVRLRDLDTAYFKGKKLLLDIRHFNECDNQFVNQTTMIAHLQAIGYVNPTSFEVSCILGNPDWIDDFENAGLKVFYSIYSMNEYENCKSNFPTLDGFVIKNDDFSAADIAEIKADNKKVYIFEIRSPKGIRSALKKYPTGLLTDDLRATLIEQY